MVMERSETFGGVGLFWLFILFKFLLTNGVDLFFWGETCLVSCYVP